MKLDFFTVLINVLALMLIAVPGYIFRKNRMLGPDASKPLAVLLIYVIQPFFIIMSFQDKKLVYNPALLSNMGFVALSAVIIQLLMLLVGKAVFGALKTKPSEKGIYTFASAFSNCGYIGIPVISSLFRGWDALSEMLVYLSVYITVFNVINWCVGIYIISGNKKYISIKNALINPTTVALYIALPLFFTNISLYTIAEPFADAFKLIGDMTTPLAMIIIGIKLAEMPLKQIFSTKRVYVAAALKLFAMPFIMMGLLYFFKGYFSMYAYYVLVIVTAMPVATITVVNAERFGGDSLAAAKCMLCSTLLSILSIPVMCMFL